MAVHKIGRYSTTICSARLDRGYRKAILSGKLCWPKDTKGVD